MGQSQSTIDISLFLLTFKIKLVGEIFAFNKNRSKYFSYVGIYLKSVHLKNNIDLQDSNINKQKHKSWKPHQT